VSGHADASIGLSSPVHTAVPYWGQGPTGPAAPSRIECRRDPSGEQTRPPCGGSGDDVSAGIYAGGGSSIQSQALLLLYIEMSGAQDASTGGDVHTRIPMDLAIP